MAAVVAVVAVVAALPAAALTLKGVRDELDRLSFVAPELRVVETPTDAETIRDRVPNMAAIDAFRAEHGAIWRFTVDERRGAVSLLEGGAIPLLPGHANDLALAEAPGCRSARCVPIAVAEARARELLARHRDALGIPTDELVLDRDGSGAVGNSTFLMRFQWQPGGVPVERGSVYLRVNGGNLIQVATERVSLRRPETEARLEAADAWRVAGEYLGPFRSGKDEVVDAGTLRLVPTSPAGMDPNVFDRAYGAGVDYRLAWHLSFRRPGVVGLWEAVVDASNGELLRFVDAARYGRIHGGAYPGDNHVGEADRPFPFADTGLPAPNDYADSAGLFEGDNATTTLKGRYAWINDDCGPISNATTSGDVDFSLGDGTDCAVPSPNQGGAGNTHSSRTQYYHVTSVNMKARTYMPANSWLNNDHMNVNVNGGAWCNATSGGGSINFYQGVPGDCWNLGEIPSVSLHEWGHSMDDFDGSGGDSPPVETRADWTASIQIHDSCCGRGFYLTGNCDGYGDACTDCSGIRDADVKKHENQTPWTAANHGTFWDCGGSGSYNGPCNLEDHCESGISTQALWEFVNTDLVAAPTSLDLTTAWQLEDRLFFAGMPTMGDMYSCTPPSSNGCNGGGLYAVMRALDDDGDGTGNGTPHAAAIYSALARHNIACGSSGDPTNQNQSTCPALQVTALTATAGSNAAVLSWAAVANATRYLVYRNDISCTAGFTKVGETSATSFTDETVVNGIEYYYRFQAATASDSCVSAMSACATVTPQPCAGSVRVDADTYACTDTIAISLLDSDLAGSGSYDVTVWSTAETTPETVTLTETGPGTSRFNGTILTSSATTHGDGAVGVVDGSTITVRYVDVDYCGTPNVTVDATAEADCVGPGISAVQVANVTGMSADVAWATDEPASSVVTYDVAIPPAAGSATAGGYVTSHAVPLTGLAECTDYVFSVTSVDPAGNSTTATNGGAYYAFATGKNTMPSYPSTDTPQPIADNATVNSVIAVADAKTVVDVNVLVNITHTYDGDLDLSLVGPNGTVVDLSSDNGGSGENFVNTLFDDEAATSITAGSPPFTGSFRPEQPLAAFDGIDAAGTWTLRVTDDAGGDTGTLNSWALNLTYPAAACGPSAKERSHALVADSCGLGGTGVGNGRWDAGETVQFSVTLENDGTEPLTGVTATVTAITPGVVVLDGVADFGDVPSGALAVSQAPHFTVQLPLSLFCGQEVELALSISAAEGSWADTFGQQVGQVNPGGGTAFAEDFDAAGIPATWTVVDGGGDGVTWFTDNASDPSGCGNTDPDPPMGGNWAAVDSDCAPSANMDEQLISPVVNLTGVTTAAVVFDHFLSTYSSEIADVDVSSSLTGGAWVNVARYTSDTPNPAHETVDITAQAAGAADVRVRWHYYDANFEWYWYVDNVEVTYTAPGSCDMSACGGTLLFADDFETGGTARWSSTAP